MVHLSKLAVGIRDIAHLSDVQAGRLREEGVLRHRTRLAPRRAEELVGNGSIYWVIAGMMLVRQQVQAIEPSSRPDGAPCAALCLALPLIAVSPRAVRAFQGWRYLEVDDAPADLAAADAADTDSLPLRLRLELHALALL